MAEKIIYKNHCTPQEQADFTTGNDRYYLDSDVGSTASDSTTVAITASGTPTYEYLAGT